ncbi:MAG: hypothetical protein LBT05_11395 [Planctomycetaceae bacterium]|nr:hypothetical protein [Planctomycetaceae bacterium]
MMNRNIAKIFTCLFFSILIVGCSEKIPANFPKNLVPFNVKLLNKGVPVEEAWISFVPENMTTEYAINTFTNKAGVAEIKTWVGSFSQSGVPAGTYQAVILHEPKPSREISQHEIDTLKLEELMAIEAEIKKEQAKLPKPVPKAWGDSKTSPLKITIPEKGGSVTIEITDSKTFEQ